MKYIENNNFKIKSDPLKIYKIDIHETGNYATIIHNIDTSSHREPVKEQF